jgi:hypothetical protein
MDFYQTIMGRKFYEADVPRMIKGIERIAIALEQQNTLTKQGGDVMKLLDEADALEAKVFDQAVVAAMQTLLDVDRMAEQAGIESIPDEQLIMLYETIINTEHCVMKSGEVDVPDELRAYLEVAGFDLAEEVQARVSINFKAMKKLVNLT